MRSLLIGIIWIYRPLRGVLFPPSCRFHPSCSRYAEDALRAHGVFEGIRLTLLRVWKCHPFHPGGFDPCPARTSD